LTFEGQAFDSDGDMILKQEAYLWKSSLDSILGNGRMIAPGGLSPGLHRITLQIEYPDLENHMSAFVEIFIDPSDDKGIMAQIFDPHSGESFSHGTAVTFSGAARESDGTIIAGPALVWTSSMDGIIGIGETCIVNNLSLGFHRITMTVHAPSGGLVSKSILLLIS
jgi:hypothetical protein